MGRPKSGRTRATVCLSLDPDIREWLKARAAKNDRPESREAERIFREVKDREAAAGIPSR